MIYTVLVKNILGRRWGLNREGGLINFRPLKSGGGGLLEGGELFERGALNRGFRVIHKFFFFLIVDTDGSLRKPPLVLWQSDV